MRIRSEVESLDLERRTVRVRDLEAGRTYDEPLRPAASSRPAASRCGRRSTGSTRTASTGCRPSTTARRCARSSTPATCRSVVVVGGGYIGLEIAEAAKSRGFEVTVVDLSRDADRHLRPGRRPLPRRCGARGSASTLILGDGGRPDRDRPRRPRLLRAHQERPDPARRSRRPRPRRAARTSALAEAAGIPLGASGGIAVDQRMRTKVDGRLGGRRLRRVGPPPLRRPRRSSPLGHAREQAGAGLRHQHRRRLRHLSRGHRHRDHQDLRARGRAHRAVGGRRPRRPGYEYVTADVDSTTRAGYYPGAEPIRLKMIAERGSGRLLGAQIVGQGRLGEAHRRPAPPRSGTA